MDATVNKFGIGQPVRRVEDQRFITGRGSYVDDIALPRQCYGVVVMSPHAHARIVRIDTSKAAAAEGVLCVLTGKDAAADGIGTLMDPMPEDVGGPKGYRARRPLLAADKVRAVGDRVAFVVAETLRQAQDAAELIEVDYEMLPAVTAVEDAVKAGAPAVWDDNPGNVAFTLAFGNKDATDAAFAKARHTVSLRLESNRLSANAIEPRAAIGDYNAADDAYTLYATSQNPHGNRSQLATNVLKIPETRLRVISPDVGGGFGMKCGGYPEDGLVLWASRRLGRPVKWTSTRSEALLGDTHGRDQVVRGELALDEKGKVLGLRVNSMHAVGSHTFGSTMVNIFFTIKLAPGVYDMPALHAVGKGVFTNTGPVHPYRGAGRPEATYLIERLARSRRRGDRHRSGGNPAAQFHPSGADAAQDRHQHHLRQRRLRACDGRVPQARGLDRAFPSAPPLRRRAASCAGAGSAISSKRRRCSTTAWRCASIRAAW